MPEKPTYPLPDTVLVETLIPEECIEELRNALNRAGILRVGNYDHCLSFHRTQGYWRPLPGSSPHMGTPGEICHGSEFRVSFSCASGKARQAMHIIREIHPYEEPLLYVLPLLNDFFQEREKNGGITP